MGEKESESQFTSCIYRNLVSDSGSFRVTISGQLLAKVSLLQMTNNLNQFVFVISIISIRTLCSKKL